MPTSGRDLCAPLPPPRRLRPVPGVPGALATVLAGEEVVLLAERALTGPAAPRCSVADVHLGKAASLRAGGVPVPRGATATDLDRLDALVQRTGSRRLVVLGDFIHAATGRVPALDAAVTAWRARHPDLALELVRGNHDRHAGDPPPAWRVAVVAAPHLLAAGPFVLHHEPAIPPTGYALCGHVHPGVRLTGAAGDSLRLPCFVLGLRSALLPAFGRLTGLALVSPRAGETVVAVAGTTLHALPPVGC